MLNFLSTAAKAVTALIVGGVSSYAASHGFDLTDTQVAALTAAITAVFVYLIPNKPAQPKE